MSFLRALGILTGSFLFTTFLVLGIMMMSIVDLTSHDNIKSLATDILENQIASSSSNIDLQDMHNFLLFQCTQMSKTTLALSDKLPPVVLDCNDIRNSDKSQLPNLIAGSLVDSIYYREFGCDFSNLLQCAQSPGNTLEGSPIFFISNEANQLYKQSVTWMWVGTALGLLVLLVSIETFAGRIKGVGWNLIIASFPVLVLNNVQSFLPTVPSQVSDIVKPVIDNLISSLSTMFIIVFAIGIAFLVAGYGLQFYQSKKQKKRKK